MSTKEHLVCGLTESELNTLVVALGGYQNYIKQRRKDTPELNELVYKVTNALLFSRDLNSVEYVSGKKPDLQKMGVAEAKVFLSYMEQQ